MDWSSQINRDFNTNLLFYILPVYIWFNSFIHTRRACVCVYFPFAWICEIYRTKAPSAGDARRCLRSLVCGSAEKFTLTRNTKPPWEAFSCFLTCCCWLTCFQKYKRVRDARRGAARHVAPPAQKNYSSFTCKVAGEVRPLFFFSFSFLLILQAHLK